MSAEYQIGGLTEPPLAQEFKKLETSAKETEGHFI